MKRIIKFIIRIYQKTISPMFPNSCRFYPTCSNYAIEAIEKHGIFYGAILSIKRILRCNPFNAGGFDYVPDKIKKFFH